MSELCVVLSFAGACWRKKPKGSRLILTDSSADGDGIGRVSGSPMICRRGTCPERESSAPPAGGGGGGNAKLFCAGCTSGAGGKGVGVGAASDIWRAAGVGAAGGGGAAGAGAARAGCREGLRREGGAEGGGGTATESLDLREGDGLEEDGGL